MPPSQAVETSTSALATPPWRMNAAAITNSGSAISVEELSWSMTTCATPISGWPRDEVQDRRAGAEHQEDRHARGEQAEEHAAGTARSTSSAIRSQSPGARRGRAASRAIAVADGHRRRIEAERG